MSQGFDKSKSKSASVRDAIRQLPASRIAEISALGIGDPEVIPLCYGEGDLPTPSFIAAAATAAPEAGHTFYTWKAGLPAAAGVERVLAACDARTRGIFVNSPSNPTGWVISDGQIGELVAAEVYGRIVYGNRAAPSFLDRSAAEDRLIVVNSFSKTWAMTGWRLGWMMVPPELVPVMEKLAEFNTSGSPRAAPSGRWARANCACASPATRSGSPRRWRGCARSSTDPSAGSARSADR